MLSISRVNNISAQHPDRRKLPSFSESRILREKPIRKRFIKEQSIIGDNHTATQLEKFNFSKAALSFMVERCWNERLIWRHLVSLTTPLKVMAGEGAKSVARPPRGSGDSNYGIGLLSLVEYVTQSS